MAFNSFYLNILTRILVLSLTNLGFFYLLINRERFFTILFLGLLFILQVIWLFYFVNSTNRSLARFLLTLGEEDAMQLPLQDKIEKTFQGLQHSFQKVNREISRIRLEKQYASVLIRNIVDHLGSGILAWDNEGQVEMINKAGFALLNLTSLDKISLLEDKYPGLVNRLEKINSGEKVMIYLAINNVNIPFLFRATDFLLGKKNIILVSFQSIRSELEENEMISWERLIRVLTHEVSNSMTPITTLGSNIKKRLATVTTEKKNVYPVKRTLVMDIQRSAELIEQRGNRLIDFIQQYKNLLRLPEPDLKPVTLQDLIKDVCFLCENLESQAKYRISYYVMPRDLICKMDRKMIEQVLINLIRNAVDALTRDRYGTIEVTAGRENQDTIFIRITDNGQGISPDIIDQVFIPFFTTREKGSGIGLSLSRRIVHLHGGTIYLQSEEKRGTTVFIIMPDPEL